MTNYRDNAFAPGMTSDAYIPDQLIAGDLKIVSDTVTLTGAAALKRGSVLGAVLASAAAVAAADGGNTGDGAMGAVTVGAGAQDGVYVLQITKAAANAGDFEVIDPAGHVVGVGAVAVAFDAGGLAFTLADGATDFAVGDKFTIAVSSAVVKHKLSDKDAGDGSQIMTCILADDADPSGGDVQAGVYRMGEFNANALTLGTGHTTADAKAQLAQLGIFVKSSVSAADPS
ncbi:head decoration protein [Phenylobacterium sp.]|uniref:head decoration protein n=1 Tax=Phenylobacterium sp. TaxID=1871053 RepID=UPI0035B3EE7C